MLKEKKLDYQHGCEEYIEKEKLYEMFEDMMKSLIVHRPEDPVQFLIDKLQKPQMMRIVMVGPPGSKRKEIALGLSTHFTEQGKKFDVISVGDLINRQII
jgi:adenylate kinase